MNIKELQKKFEFTGVDVDMLVTNILELLTKYHHRCTKKGIISLLNTYIDNKADLLHKMVEMPEYNGNLQLVYSAPFERKIDNYLAHSLADNLNRITQPKKNIVTKVNKEGKTIIDKINDNIKELPESCNLNDLENIEPININISEEFDKHGDTVESLERYRKYYAVYSILLYYYSQYLTEDVATRINSIIEKFNAKEGMKTSKAFNRLFTIFKLNEKCENYNKVFAQYADNINPTSRELPYIISLNPIDYLTMSFGTTWASCHTIDKENLRKSKGQHYSGSNCGGTLSYMLDGVSFVTYVLLVKSDRPETIDKLYRNMMHYKDGLLVQGRVYPQGNDGALDLYKKLRLLFQEKISKMEGIEYVENGLNSTWIYKGKSRNSDFIHSEGVHYTDYDIFDDCNVSYLRSKGGTCEITIGHEGIDVATGDEYSCNSSLFNPYARIEEEQEIAA